MMLIVKYAHKKIEIFAHRYKMNENADKILLLFIDY